MNKKKKRQLMGICAAFVVILAVYLGFGYYQSHKPEETEAAITVTDMDSALITAVSVSTETGSVTFEKDGDAWLCPEDEEFSVDTEQLQTFLDAAVSITSDVMIENVTDMGQYGLEDGAVVISLQTDEGTYEIKIGDQNTLIGSYYLCIGGEDRVYTIDSLQYYSLNREKEDFEAEEVEAEEEAEETEEAPEETEEEAETTETEE